MTRKKKATKKKAPSQLARSSRLRGLIDRASVKTTRGAPCFAQLLKGDAKAFIDEVTRMEQAGEYLNKRRSHEILTQELGVEIAASVMARHLRGLCKCFAKG